MQGETMFRVAIFNHQAELNDTFLAQMAALGAQAIDFVRDTDMPGVKEHGLPDLDEVKALRRRLRSFGLEINRVTLPDLTETFMNGGEGAEAELMRTSAALRIYAQAGIPLARQRLAGDVFPQMTTRYQSVHRGGYRSRGETLIVEEARSADQAQAMGLDIVAGEEQAARRGAGVMPSRAELDRWWNRFHDAFSAMVPIAEDHNIRLAVHPSDTPNVDTPLGSLGLHRVIDAFPSPMVGFVYCIGTRAEAGGSALVLDEINHYGRKGKIFMVHMRNVRGSLATAGAFEETLLDDGDLNMFKILMELKKVGFSGYINPDHIPAIPGDTAIKTAGWAYSIGYLKALFAAAAV